MVIAIEGNLIYTVRKRQKENRSWDLYMDYQSIATFIMEMAGTVAFAASGAMVGVERNMDIFGVSVLGVATAVGGGMIRDIVLGVIPPAVFRNPVYALVSVLTS